MALRRLFSLGACLVAPVVMRIIDCPSPVYVSLTQAKGKSEQWKFDNGSTGKRLDDSGPGYYKLLRGLY